MKILSLIILILLFSSCKQKGDCVLILNRSNDSVIKAKYIKFDDNTHWYEQMENSKSLTRIVEVAKGKTK